MKTRNGASITDVNRLLFVMKINNHLNLPRARRLNATVKSNTKGSEKWTTVEWPQDIYLKSSVLRGHCPQLHLEHPTLWLWSLIFSAHSYEYMGLPPSWNQTGISIHPSTTCRLWPTPLLSSAFLAQPSTPGQSSLTISIIHLWCPLHQTPLENHLSVQIKAACTEMHMARKPHKIKLVGLTWSSRPQPPRGHVKVLSILSVLH